MVHFSFVEFQQIDNFIELLSASFDLLLSLVSLFELEERGAEGFHYPRQFLFQHSTV